MHARIAKYEYTGDAHELVQQVEEGLLPIFQSQPGFKAYMIIESEGKIMSFSAWDSAESADAANRTAAQWVAENFADRVTLKDTRIGEILLSTALGVSTMAGARA